MNICFDTSLADEYKSRSQRARVLTEAWVADNLFCPRCGNPHLLHFKNNRPVADFYCDQCKNEYELKSKGTKFGGKITDGAYSTMLARIHENNNPDFLLMHYADNRVKNLTLIPKHFLLPSVIEKRKPLSDNAKRAGWVGCNILLSKIPIQGRIPIISDAVIADIDSVVRRTSTAYRLEVGSIDARGWLMDVLNCVNSIPHDEFTLSEVYRFEEQLRLLHPNNNNIKPKIRQQLQFLRDRGILTFLGNGHNKKVWT